MTLSTREKILLFILAIGVVVFVGIKYIISPVYQSSKKDQAQLADLLTQQTIAKQKTAAVGSASSTIQKALSDANSAASSILPQPDTELLNTWFINLAQGNGLKVTAISFSPASVTDIGSTTGTAGTTAGTDSVGKYRLKDYSDNYNGTPTSSAPAAQSKTASSSSSSSSSASSASSTSSAASAKEGGLVSVNVTLNMTGTYAQGKAMLDTIRGCGKTAVVTSFNCTTSNNTYSFVMVVQCYGGKKLDNSDTTFAWSLPKPAGRGDVM